MKRTKIKFGYEIGTGKEIEIPMSHTVITGLTNESGKTTAVMGLIKRSGLKALIIKTKIGEKAITEGSIIPPFYKETFDWEFASELLEASRKEKLKFERSWIIRYSKTATNLLEFKKNIDDALAEGKIRELDKSVLITLQAYLDKILPELQYAPLSKTLDIRDGINIMDLERFKEETQTIIIRSVIQEVLNKEKNVLIVIPECLVKNTLILMEEGYPKFIQDIKEGERVIGGKISNRITKEVGTLLKFNTNTELITTLTHPHFIIPKGMLHKRKYRNPISIVEENEIKQVLASEIQLGDYFLVPREIPHINKYNYTPEQLGFIGLILTDGNVRRGKNWGLVRVNVSKDVDWFRDQFKRGLNAFGFLDYYKETKDKNRKSITFSAQSKELADILWGFGCYGGKKANIIDITRQIWFSPLDSIRNFINICFSCEGYVGKDGRARIVTTSEFFMKKLQLLLLKFGIHSILRRQKGKKYISGEIWELYVVGASLSDFKEKIGLSLERKNKLIKFSESCHRLVEFQNKLYVLYPITKIRKLHNPDKEFNHQVYDFETENHWFLANGILTHNCWKYLPERLNTPVKRPAEAFIRQGATNNNFLILDSQDVTGVSKSILKQVSNWILGYQREFNEIKRTLDQIPLSNKIKPKPENIATLKLGQFFVATSDFVKKCYAQPCWMEDKIAVKIAKGQISVEDIEQPTHIAPYQIITKKQEETEIREYPFTSSDISAFNKKINELREDFISNRNDFFNKFQQINETVSAVYSEIYKIRNENPKINEDEIVMRVLQKIPTSINPTNPTFDKELIIKEVLARVPRVAGNVTYEVSPQEKIKKDFLEEAKSKVLSDISTLNDKSKKILKYLESRGVGLSVNEICMKALLYPNGAGGYSKIVNDSMKELSTILVAEKQTNGKCFGRLKERISFLLKDNEATEQEIEQVYNHILMEMLR